MGSTSQHKMAVTGCPRNFKVNSVVMLYNYFWQNGTFVILYKYGLGVSG